MRRSTKSFSSERSQCETADFERSRTQVHDRIELERLAQRDQYEQLKHDHEVTSTQLMELRESVAVIEEENSFLKQEILAKSSQVKQYAKEVDRLKKHVRGYFKHGHKPYYNSSIQCLSLLTLW